MYIGKKGVFMQEENGLDKKSASQNVYKEKKGLCKKIADYYVYRKERPMYVGDKQTG